ncbi:MAG TPA: deoxyribose-phosphate aldolase [Anaerolineales bacterium]
MSTDLDKLLAQADAYLNELPVAPHMHTVPTGPALAGWIDHTNLKPDATAAQITKLCEEAREHLFATVCVNPAYVPLAAKQLQGSGVEVCSVVGFPLGATFPELKASETRQVIATGATEVDMVINIGALKSADFQLVLQDISAVVTVATAKARVKVILEMCYLDQREKIIGCLLAKQAGADFVKTSTGFGAGGATVEDVSLMRRVVGNEMGVKAAGGIRTWPDALRMITAGANRLGASAGVLILKEVGAI